MRKAAHEGEKSGFDDYGFQHLKATLDDLEIDQEVKVDGLVFEREKV